MELFLSKAAYCSWVAETRSVGSIQGTGALDFCIAAVMMPVVLIINVG